MGWCSATEIMDAAVDAAERAAKAAVAQVYEQAVVLEKTDDGRPPHHNATVMVNVDEVLRPFVARIAEKLRDGDWDCIEEAAHFDRFRREMLGYDHRQMAEWCRDRLTEDYEPTPAQVREYGALLAHHLEESTRGR